MNTIGPLYFPPWHTCCTSQVEITPVRHPTSGLAYIDTRRVSMKKFLSFLMALLLILGAAGSVHAVQWGIGSASLDLNSLRITSKDAFGIANYGYYSYSAAMAMDQDAFDTDAYYSAVLDSWAYARTDGAFAATGFNE
jgi:hypothetical protein